MKSLWECIECGHKQMKWTGSCVQCKSWNSFIEQDLPSLKKTRIQSLSTSSKPVLLKDLQACQYQRVPSDFKEFDRLLGGGVVPGSLLLLGGDPGIGKSTLLLQISERFANKGKKVLYISGEESQEQIYHRAERLKISSDHLYIYNETVFSTIKAEIDRIKPDLMVVDSVQILFKSELPSAPGSIVQVKEIATEFMHIAKGLGIITFLIGHVTKSGDLAGPRVLEHLVDVVFEFEGDKQHGFRILRSIKNRFGPTDDLVLFQMHETGLKEIQNPSIAFLQERKNDIPGSVIVPTMEGVRSILVEIQALVSSSPYPAPARKSTGIDPNRLALLLAVLEKRVGYKLYHYDVFVSIAGGLKVVEPSIDLGIAMSIASSFANRPIDSHTIVLGEIGLGGEIRGVPRVEKRIKEAEQMGFTRCVLPKKTKDHLKIKTKIQLFEVELIEEAINLLL